MRIPVAIAAAGLLLVGCSGAPSEPSSLASSAPFATHVWTWPDDSGQVHTFAPEAVAIPALGITAVIEPVGMMDEATMEVPEDIRTVGWFLHSAHPGSARGSTVLVGHRDGTTDPNGVFRRLADLQRGQAILVEDSSGSTWEYTVASVDLLAGPVFADRAPLLFDIGREQRLVLLTCGGSYDAQRGGYQATVVVTADPA